MIEVPHLFRCTWWHHCKLNIHRILLYSCLLVFLHFVNKIVIQHFLQISSDVTCTFCTVLRSLFLISTSARREAMSVSFKCLLFFGISLDNPSSWHKLLDYKNLILKSQFNKMVPCHWIQLAVWVGRPYLGTKIASNGPWSVCMVNLLQWRDVWNLFMANTTPILFYHGIIFFSWRKCPGWMWNRFNLDVFDWFGLVGFMAYQPL